MNASDDDYGTMLLNAIKYLNAELDTTLESMTTPNGDGFSTDSIPRLLEQRAKLMQALSVWRASPPGELYVSQHSVAWSSEIDNLESSDTERLHALRGMMDSAGEHLRTTQQRKSVLLYK
ncbi:MAG: hypothetical protein JNL32_13695 [Candidatus Kapabacteria bacterium]|nr:hypothetical protein [Candidatus Kapabacteria bacterium]